MLQNIADKSNKNRKGTKLKKIVMPDAKVNSQDSVKTRIKYLKQESATIVFENTVKLC